jgi:hypothetical protein
MAVRGKSERSLGSFPEGFFEDQIGRRRDGKAFQSGLVGGHDTQYRAIGLGPYLADVYE